MISKDHAAVSPQELTRNPVTVQLDKRVLDSHRDVVVVVQRRHRSVADPFQEPFESGAVAGPGKRSDSPDGLHRFRVVGGSSASRAKPPAVGRGHAARTLAAAGRRAQVRAQFFGVGAPRARAHETLGGRQVTAPVARAPQRLRVRGRYAVAAGYGHRGHHPDGRPTVGRVPDEHVFGVRRAAVGHHGRARVHRPEVPAARPAHVERVRVQHGGRLEGGPVVVEVAGRGPQAQPVQHERGHVDGVRPVQRRVQPVVQVRLQRPELRGPAAGQQHASERRDEAISGRPAAVVVAADQRALGFAVRGRGLAQRPAHRPPARRTPVTGGGRVTRQADGRRAGLGTDDQRPFLEQHLAGGDVPGGRPVASQFRRLDHLVRWPRAARRRRRRHEQYDGAARSGRDL